MTRSKTSLSEIHEVPTVHVVVFLGIGQSGKNHTVVSQHFPGITVVAPIPFHTIPQDRLENESLKYYQDSLEAVYNQHGPLRVIAESQAAPGVTQALHKNLAFAQSITLISPLGLNCKALGHTPYARYKELLRRSYRFWRHPNQSLTLAANRHTLIQLAMSSLPYLSRLKSDYIFGANQDISHIVHGLSEHKPIYIYADEHDSLFPLHEIAKTVADTQVTLKPLHDGSHINRASLKGIESLREIIASLNNVPERT